jgi:ParB family chromosome partitioning protein
MTTTSTPTRGSFAAMYEASRSLSHDSAPRQLRLALMEPNPEQPRQTVHAETVEELAASIRAHGLLQPIMVRPHPSGQPNRWQIVAGERRWRACQLAGLDAVPVVIRTLDDATARQIALIENLQREDITALEEAHVLKQILDETGLSHREIGERIGKTKAYVEQRVRLLRYPDEVRQALGRRPAADGGAFTPGHAKAVVQLSEPAARAALIAEIESKGLTVRDAEKRVHAAMAKAQKPAPVDLEPGDDLPVELASLEIVRLVKAAQAKGTTTVDRAALRKALRADLARL